jgi:hypothetical protein
MSNRRRLKPRRHATEPEQPTAPCADCGTDTLPLDPGKSAEFYMVHDHIWAAAGMPPIPAMRDYLCVGCIEARLGHQLTAADFTDVDVNSISAEFARYAWSHRSGRLLGRLIDGMDPAQLEAAMASWRRAVL